MFSRVASCVVLIAFPFMTRGMSFASDDAVRAEALEGQGVETTVDASLEQVWAAFTTAEGLRSWLAPHVEIDLKIGGKWKSNYRSEGKIGDPDTIENTILSYDPERMLSVRASKVPVGFPFPNAIKDVWHVMYFSAVTSDCTKVSVVGLGYTDTEESQNLNKFFTAANAQTLANLKAGLEE